MYGKHCIPKKYYDRDRLKAMFLFKGKASEHAKGYNGYMQPAADMLHCEYKTAQYKINHGALSHEETILLAIGLELTPREYFEIFMKDVFQANTPSE